MITNSSIAESVDLPPDVHFLPEPSTAIRRYMIVSVDDHLVEPPDTFRGRMPCRFGERVPHVVELPNGAHAWQVDGSILPTIGKNAVAGRPILETSEEPTRFEYMRRGAWDVDARIHDMNIDGVYASLSFPSFVAGFGGARLQTVTDDRDFALAAVRAWNSWHIEDWAGHYPDRLIPCQIAWLHDAEIAAAEVLRNADRGFKAVTFPEQPHVAGFPSLHSGYWERFLRACEETGTVICLHTGSAGSLPSSAPDAPREASSALFGAGFALTPTVDWLFSQVGIRYPEIKICMAEGGIGWVPSLIDRLDYMYERTIERGRWPLAEPSPSDVLRRNFWFCMIHDPSSLSARYEIGLGNILVETDYPHADSTWPRSQQSLHDQLHDLPDDEVALLTWRNASELFRHPVPVALQNDPTAGF